MPEKLIRNRPTPEGEELGAHLARLTMGEKALDAYRERFPDAPEPCRSCAFRPGTVPNGCLTTVATALKCVMEHVPFNCHETCGDAGEPSRSCQGWAIAMASLPPGAKPVKMPYEFPE